MNQPQKNNSQTTDIRQKHINAIRQRLKQKREEYCKTRSDKNILGPGAIHNYLKENYHVYTSQTTIQNFFSNSDGIQKIDISAVPAMCDWWGCDPGEILAFPDQSSFSTSNSYKQTPHQQLLLDTSYNGKFHCYFFKISGTDSSFNTPYPYSLKKREDLIKGTITFNIDPDNGSKAYFEYKQLVHQFQKPDEIKVKRCTCFPMESTLNHNIYLDFVDQDGRFYYIFFNHQVFINGPLYFRIGGMITESSEHDNGPFFQKIVLFHERPDDSQDDLIRGLLNTNPYNYLLDERELERLAATDTDIKKFWDNYKDLLAPRKREIYFFNETLITKESGYLSEYDAKKTLIKLRHHSYSQNQIIIGRDEDAHRIARRMQNPKDIEHDDYQ